MSRLLRRPLSGAVASAAALALTAALLVLCASLQPGASIHLWLLFGTIAVGASGILAGVCGAVLSACATLAAVDYFALAPAGSFKLPAAPSDVVALLAFIAAAAAAVRLSWKKDVSSQQATVAGRLSRRLDEEAHRRVTLLKLNERVLAGGSLEVVRRNAVDAVAEALDLPYALVLEPGPDDQLLTVAAGSGWTPRSFDGVAIPATVDSQIGYARVTREPVVVADAGVEEKFPVPAEFRTRGVRSGIALGIGLLRSFGVLAAYDISPRRFDDADVEFVCGVAAILASAYERSHLERERAELVSRDEMRREEAQLAARRASFLAHTAPVLDAALDPETTLVSLARLAVPAIADCAVVDLVEDDGEVRRVDVVDIDPIRREDVDALRRLSPDLRTEGPFPRAIRTGQPVLLPELGKLGATQAAPEGDHVRALARLGCQSLLLIPLVARGQTLALLTLGSRVPHRYDGADLALAQELASRAAIALDNGRLHRDAEAASRAKDEFLATVSHELRTPLNAVLGWTAMLRRRPIDEARAQHALEAIERSVHAQARLLEQLLDISRIVSGKFELRLGPVYLADVVAAAIDAVRPGADERGIRIEQRIDPELPAITGDADRLQQVIVNLLANALKFTPDDGVVEVELRSTEEATAEIVVRDHGAGINREFLPHVFDRFRQSAMSGSISNKGLGLGLAIVKEIVERHGGSVAAESAGEGKGATFRVRLPMGPAADAVRLRQPRRSGAREVPFDIRP
ncbi:MAG TPA: ATP-binding protein [Vicinamibacterales bacterium]|nr:ATP-binding protein [Vicinamibacterales bacterium]